MVTAASEDILCNFHAIDPEEKKSFVCFVNQTIASETYAVKSSVNDSVQQFYIHDDRDVKFLPTGIGEKFPNLTEIRATSCGLVLVRRHYLKNMRNLKNVRLNDNKIAYIESRSFNDLVSLERLWFRDNLVEILDRDLFIHLAKLELVDFVNNKIKFLSAKTFNIPGGHPQLVDLRDNVCIDQIYGTESYGRYNMHQLDPDIELQCSWV